MISEWIYILFKTETSRILPTFLLSHGSWLQWLSAVTVTCCIQLPWSDLQIEKQAVGVCGMGGRRHRDGLEGEGWRNKGRIVVQTEEISRDRKFQSWSCNKSSLSQWGCPYVLLYWWYLGAESWCASPIILQGTVWALVVSLKGEDVCVWLGALAKSECRDAFVNRHFAATKLTGIIPLKDCTAHVKGLAIWLLFQLLTHASYTACFISVF